VVRVPVHTPCTREHAVRVPHGQLDHHRRLDRTDVPPARPASYHHLIIVGQNVQAAAADARAQATYDDAAAVLEEARQIQAHLAAQDAVLERIIEAIRQQPSTGANR